MTGIKFICSLLNKKIVYQSRKIKAASPLIPSISLLLMRMQVDKSSGLLTESTLLTSEFLERDVKVDFYLPGDIQKPEKTTLLLLNDGQDLVTMGFARILGQLYARQKIKPLLCVGIHCGEDRKNEYGMAGAVDFKGRGAKAGLYQQFVFNELLPHIYQQVPIKTFKERAYAGFSLGGLSALDIVWNHPDVFSTVGVFSGSLWWRAKDKNDKTYNEANDRLMHRQIRLSTYKPGLKFFFQTGELDESEDRNRNGVIDSIDDTIDLMKELASKGYREGKDMHYLQFADGRHDVPTWARALPTFLEWGWGKK